jgi:hypothetical protein
MEQFKIRCSAIGQIMTEPRSKSELLSKTTITYIEEWMKEQIYGRRKRTESKYMDKGILMEDEAIEFVSSYYPEMPLLIKNEKNFASEYMTGTPDITFSDEVIDIKCSWDCFTFPLFEKELPEKNYYWQLQGYFHLTGASRGRIIYVLTNTPDSIVEKEISYSPDREDEIIAYHNYRNIPDKYKVKSFDVLRNDEDIERIKQRVIECRNYINQLL